MDLDQLKQDLIRDEGLRLKAYKCTMGKTTVGVGRNLDDNGLTEAEAMYLLDNDLAKVTAQLDKELSWWRGRPDHVQRAMANACFQLGINGLLGFKKGLACLQAGDYNGAKLNFLDSDWAKQTPNRAAHVIALFTP